MHKGTRRKKRGTAPVWATLRASLLGTAAATAAMLLFALTIYWNWLGEGAIPYGNAIVKAGAAVLAGWLAARANPPRVWLYGGLAGLGFFVLSTALFSALKGGFTPSWMLLSDALLSFALAAGAALLTPGRREKE